MTTGAVALTSSTEKENNDFKITLAYDRGGLGNRMKCLIGAWRRDGEAKFRWESTISCPTPEMATLFCYGAQWQASKTEIENPLHLHCSWRLPVWSHDPVPANFSAVRESYGTSSEWRDIDFEYSRIPHDMIELYQPLFERFVPEPSLAQFVDAFCWRHDFAQHKVVGVHIRSWHDEATRRESWFDFNAFVQTMRSLIVETPSVRFFVCSDSPDVIRKLTDTFGPIRILTRGVESRFDDGQGAWLDMLLLSRTHTLIASHASTMSEVAWWLAKCRLRVVVVCKGRPVVDHAAIFLD